VTRIDTADIGKAQATDASVESLPTQEGLTCSLMFPQSVIPRRYRQHEMLISRAFSKPSDGFEPSTPSLPWRFWGGNGVHARAFADTFVLQISR
jgi:hypothetical protein